MECHQECLLLALEVVAGERLLETHFARLEAVEEQMAVLAKVMLMV